MAEPADRQSLRDRFRVIHHHRTFHTVEGLKHQLGKAVQIGRAERQVDETVLFHDFLGHSGFLDHASAYGDHQVRPGFADFLQPCDIAEGTPFRVVTDTACIENHEIGFFTAGSGRHSHLFQHAGQLFRIMGIHLAAVCDDIIGLGTVRKQTDFMHKPVLAFNLFR